MRDDRNDLIRVGDALDAITDWLCEEELRHGIELSRRLNKFFAKVMLEKVPRTEVIADTPQTEEPTPQEYEKWLFKEPQTDCPWR